MMINDELITLQTEDKVPVALWKVSDNAKNLDKHIFLTHGTFSNKDICMGIARYFCDSGYTCWILEWRSHGASPEIKANFNFETVATYDVKAVFKYLFNTLKIKDIDCITHSGGGICLTMFLIQNPEYVSKLNTITMFSCQAFGAAFSAKNYVKILFGKIFSRILSFVPGKMLGLGPHNENYITMKQWFDWNLKKNFSGLDNFDYLSKMKNIRIPILSVCSKGDRMIEPKTGCMAFVNAFDNPVNRVMFCSSEGGFLEDYDHARVILSKNSSREIWPRVSAWIAKNGGDLK
jgi:poly(3-hydroxyalkanoate) synthetase